jgi:hypothetical protein
MGRIDPQTGLLNRLICINLMRKLLFADKYKLNTKLLQRVGHQCDWHYFTSNEL